MYTIDLGTQITTSVKNCECYYYTGCAYDTESSTLYKDVVDKDGNVDKVVDNCFVYSIQFAVGDTYFWFRSFAQFIPFLTELIAKIKQDRSEREHDAKMIVWIANLNHEWAFIKNYIQANYEITKCFAKTKRDVLLVEIERVIQFRECLGLFGHSVYDIGKTWCTVHKKQVDDLNYDLIRTFNTDLDDIEQGYCSEDVLTLTEMHTAVFNAYGRGDGVIYIPYTTSGFVRLRLKETIEADGRITEQRLGLGPKWAERNNVSLLKSQNRRLFTTADDWNLMRTYSYAGGVCGSNIKLIGKTLTRVKCADITSDYPYQMLAKRFPAGPIQTGTHKDLQHVRDKKLPHFMLLYIEHMQSKTQHAVFSKHKIINGKYGDPVYQERHGLPDNDIYSNGKVLKADNVIVLWNDVDFDTYKLAYDLDNVLLLKLWYFPWGYRRLPTWLTDNVLRDYIIKQKLKHELGKAAQGNQDYRDAKSRVNTYYGTLATRPGDIFDDVDDVDYLFKPTAEFSFDDMINNTWLNPYWAFYCTSYARQMLIQYIAKYPSAIVQYDTDSLYYRQNQQGKQLEKELTEFNAECIKANQRRFKNADNKEYAYDLGTWDFDEEYSRFICFGAKKYIKEDDDGIHTVIAGLPKTAIPKMMTKDQIKNPFTTFNPVRLNADVIIQHMFAHKFASVYNDRTDETYIAVRDYKGTTVLQPVSSYHAIVPIDFTLSVADDYLSLASQFQKIKPLKNKKVAQK